MLDGRAIESFQPPGASDGSPWNNILACVNHVPDSSTFAGEHELLISINTTIALTSTGVTTSTPWLFDYITFESLVDPILDGEVLQMGNGQVNSAPNYSMLTFGPGWTQEFTGTAFNALDNYTVSYVPHSNLTVNFNGKLLIRMLFYHKIC